MQGQLSDHPLAELLHEISTNNLSGGLRVEHGRVKAAIYAHEGCIVLASSNLRAARLVECLRRWNALDAAGWHKTEALLTMPAAASDAGLADLLVRHGVLPSATLGELRSRQTEEVLRSVLDLRDGAWTFDARVRLSEESRVRVADSRLLAEAARSAPAEFIATRFRDEREIIRAAEGREPSIELLPAEAFLLSRVEGAITIGDLLQISALPPAQALTALYALVLSGLLTRERPPRAFTSEAVARQRAAQAASTHRADGDARRDEKSRAETGETDEEKMKALFARGEASTHYGTLGISQNAPPDRIKAAYYALAKRFHPDVFSRDNTPPELRLKIEKAFAVIATAYETLKTAESRAKYDLQILSRTPATPAPTPPAATPEVNVKTAPVPPPSPASQASSPAYRAGESFQEAMRAEKAGNPVLALARFAEAARLSPQEARYRAHYGRALASDRNTRHQAEAELLAAVGLSGGDATYRLMLAEFYREVGLHRRAAGEVERVLAEQPDNANARRMLKELQRGA